MISSMSVSLSLPGILVTPGELAVVMVDKTVVERTKLDHDRHHRTYFSVTVRDFHRQQWRRLLDFVFITLSSKAPFNLPLFAEMSLTSRSVYVCVTISEMDRWTQMVSQCVRSPVTGENFYLLIIYCNERCPLSLCNYVKLILYSLLWI